MRIAVADDHPLFLEALRVRLERLFPETEVAEAADLDGLLALAATVPPCFDLILLDFRMPGMDGCAGLGRVLEAFPGSPVAVLSGSISPPQVIDLVRAGACGFLPKTLLPELFGHAVSLLLAGGSYLPAEVLRDEDSLLRATEATADAQALEQLLTPREREVLIHLAAGASNKEIGRDLGISEITVKLHVRQVFKKIGARNRAEAAAFAARRANP